MIRVPADYPIALVDDDDVDRMILAKVIERSNLANEIVTFASGEDFLTHLDDVADSKAIGPALILLDVNMPGLTGFDVLSVIRSRQEFSRVPLVAIVTSSEASQDKSLARELGADCYLAKQSGLAHFVAAVNEHFTNC